MPNFDKIASRVTAVGLLSFGVQDVRASLFGLTKPQVLLFGTQEGDLARGWDVLTSLQVEMHAACLKGTEDANDVESCDKEDQAENLQQIAKGFLRFLSLTKTIPGGPVLRSTASDVPTTSANVIHPEKWKNMSIYNKFDAWYQATDEHLENGTTLGEDRPARILNEFHPATSEEIAELFELLKSQPEEDSDFKEFMILYVKLLNWIFARYYTIAKSEDGDGNDKTLNGQTEDEALKVFTLHNFASYSYDFSGGRSGWDDFFDAKYIWEFKNLKKKFLNLAYTGSAATKDAVDKEFGVLARRLCYTSLSFEPNGDFNPPKTDPRNPSTIDPGWQKNFDTDIKKCLYKFGYQYEDTTYPDPCQRINEFDANEFDAKDRKTFNTIKVNFIQIAYSYFDDNATDNGSPIKINDEFEFGAAFEALACRVFL